jgi:hypothetical protein
MFSNWLYRREKPYLASFLDSVMGIFPLGSFPARCPDVDLESMHTSTLGGNTLTTEVWKT